MIHRITKVHNNDDFCNKYTFVYKEMVAKETSQHFTIFIYELGNKNQHTTGSLYTAHL